MIGTGPAAALTARTICISAAFCYAVTLGSPGEAERVRGRTDVRDRRRGAHVATIGAGPGGDGCSLTINAFWTTSISAGSVGVIGVVHR